MNMMIIRYRSKSPEVQRKLVQIFSKISLKEAKENCEKKYGICEQANHFTYCYKCKAGYTRYWKTKKSCGCRRTKVTPGTVLKPDKIDPKKAKKARKERQRLKSLLENHLGKGKERRMKRVKKFLARLIDNEKVNDAFYFRINE